MNHEQILDTGHSPTVTLAEVVGNLVVRGWGEPRIRARASGDALRLTQDGDQVTLTCAGDCQLYLPSASTLVVGTANADVQIAEVRGSVTVRSARGNLAVSQVGPTTLEAAHADLVVKDVAGALTIGRAAGNVAVTRIHGSVHLGDCAGDLHAKELHGPGNVDNVAGNAVLSNIHGDLRIGQCAGDLTVKSVFGALTADEVAGNCSTLNVQGDVHVSDCAGDLAVRGAGQNLRAKTAGDANLRLSTSGGGACRVEAGGDIACRVLPQYSAQVRLQSGSTIRVKRLPVAWERAEGSAEFTLGDGTGSLVLVAGGEILLDGKGDDSADFRFGPFGVEVEVDPEAQREFFERTGEWIEQMSEQVEQQLESISAQVDARLAELGTSDEIAARVQQKVQQAMRKAEDKIADAMRKAEAKAREAERRERRQTRVYSYQTPPRPPVPPTPPRPGKPKGAPASEEERLLILRMVEQGKISVEQAEALLAALER